MYVYCEYVCDVNVDVWFGWCVCLYMCVCYVYYCCVVLCVMMCENFFCLYCCLCEYCGVVGVDWCVYGKVWCCEDEFDDGLFEYVYDVCECVGWGEC